MRRIIAAVPATAVGRLVLGEPGGEKRVPARRASLGRSLIAACTGYIRGHVSPRAIFWVLLPLYTLSAIATPLVAAARFPQPFDIRYRVITNLASWRDNPDGHRIFGVGLGLMMLLLIPFPGYLHRSLGGSSFLRRAGRIELWIGTAGGFTLSVESAAVAGMRNMWGAFGKAHELYAILTFIGLALGCFSFGLCTIQTALRGGGGWKSTRVVVPSICLALMVVTTLLQLVLYLQSRIPGWTKETGDNYFLLNFAFWEWMSAASLLLLLLVISFEACVARAWTWRMSRRCTFDQTLSSQ